MAAQQPKCQVCGEDADFKYTHRTHKTVVYRCERHPAQLSHWEWLKLRLKRGETL